jgi:integrase
MARKTAGSVVARVGLDGDTYRSLRFSAGGKRRWISLGPVNASDAAQELENVLADVRRGIWQPPTKTEIIEPEAVPTFLQLASDWWEMHEGEWRAATRADYRWRLRRLKPTFGEIPIDQIDVSMVETFKAAKLREGLGARSVNMLLIALASILESGVDRELIDRNPARGKRRRVRERTPRRTYLQDASSIEALLQAAGEADAAATRYKHVHRRAILAVMLFGGLRIGEAVNLKWGAVDLAGGWLHVTASKTDAGVRRVRIRGALRDELLAIRPADADPEAFVFATSNGAQPSRENIRNRVLKPAVEAASKQLVKSDRPPLPEGITPHSLRRSYASVECAIGTDPATLMRAIGHTSPSMTLRAYAAAMDLDDKERKALRALVEGTELAFGGIPANEVASDRLAASAEEEQKTPR